MAYFIQGPCINCSRCKDVCPADAPHSNGLAFEIDPSKCISCGACAEACRLGIIYPEDYVREIRLHAPTEKTFAGGSSAACMSCSARVLRATIFLIFWKASTSGTPTAA